jgi:uncharacterized protein with NRDE domain
MCLILFALSAHPDYSLIVAANRDEAYARPSAPAAFWDDEPRICGGRDLEQKGTWLALSRSGRFAAVTNYRQGTPRSPAARSRGDLTRGFLESDTGPESYLGHIAGRSSAYNGFSLIAGDARELWFFSNRGNGVSPIAPGVHGLSNHLLDEPWPKVRRGVATLEGLLSAPEDELVPALLAQLSERTPAPEDALPSTGIARERERALSASFVAGVDYGTRASTIVLIGRDGSALLREHTYGPLGAPVGETEVRFGVESAVSRPRRLPA